jgi:hypothetical protein
MTETFNSYVFKILLLLLLLLFNWTILWSSETSDHLLEDLAKFGYKPVMKVENLNKPFIF